MKSRYTIPITRKDASAYLSAYFGTVRLPAGARYVWLAGLQYISDQPGCYFRAASGGFEGVVIVPPAQEMEDVA